MNLLNSLIMAQSAANATNTVTTPSNTPLSNPPPLLLSQNSLEKAST